MTIGPDDLVPGDVLLITRRPGNAYADLIVALDGAPTAFTHGAIALGGGRLLSSYPYVDGVSLPIAIGGLRADGFERFWGHRQSIHRLRVDPAERAAAAARLDEYTRAPSGFSITKLVVVAATLHALSPSNPIAPEATARIVRRAIALARAWGEDDGFYCAEFVAHLYGWTFTLADLVPPRWTRRVVVPYLPRLVADVVAPILAAHRTEAQKTTSRAFLAEVRRSDPAFFGPHPLASLDRRGIGARSPVGLEPVDESPVDPSTPLPGGLVTPRMLRTRHLGDDAPALVAPIGRRRPERGRESAVHDAAPRQGAWQMRS